MKVSQGSAANLKPDLVMSALEQFTGAKLPEFVQYERMDMYCLENDKNTSKDNIILNQFFTVCEDHEINKEAKQLQDITILLMFNTQVIIVKK